MSEGHFIVLKSAQFVASFAMLIPLILLIHVLQQLHKLLGHHALHSFHLYLIPGVFFISTICICFHG